MQTKKLSLRAIDNKNTLAKELLEGCECFPAHLRFAETKNKDTVEFQTVSEHCHKTASYAESALKAVGLGASAYLAGLLHDAGKYTQKYKQYLLNAFAGLDVVRGSVNHTFAAVRYLLNNFHDKQNCYNFMISELLAYAVGAHHGLFDLVADRKSVV